MAAGIFTPAIDRKLKEYKAKYGTDFMLEIANVPEDDEAARIAAIDKQIRAGVPQRKPDELQGFY